MQVRGARTRAGRTPAHCALPCAALHCAALRCAALRCAALHAPSRMHARAYLLHGPAHVEYTSTTLSPCVRSAAS